MQESRDLSGVTGCFIRFLNDLSRMENIERMASARVGMLRSSMAVDSVPAMAGTFGMETEVS